MQERLSVVGLGRMGHAMADRLAAEGQQVTGWTRSGGDPEAAKAAGYQLVPDLAGAVAASDILILSLYDETAVRSVLGQLSAMDLAGKLVVETSTVPPAVVRDCEAAIVAAGGRLIDAPVSGGPEMVIAGTIGLYIGGAEADTARFAPVAAHLSSRVVPVGALGDGVAAKIVNNLALAGAFGATMEALEVGHGLGLDLATMFAVLKDSPAITPMVRDRIPMILGEDDRVGFTVTAALKDVDVFTGAAQAVGAEVTAYGVTAGAFQAAEAAGLGDKDVAIAIRKRLGLV
ncbi:MAG: NAD(P)-dependent oxidoreductase [Pseudomonadota bacterium]